MQRRPAESVLLGEGRQRRGRRVGRDAENQVVIRIDVAFEAELGALCVHHEVRQVEVAAAGDLISEHLAAGEVQLGEDAVFETFVERLVRDLLDRELGVVQKGVILHPLRVLEIDQHGDPLAGLRVEHGAQ